MAGKTHGSRIHFQVPNAPAGSAASSHSLIWEFPVPCQLQPRFWLPGHSWDDTKGSEDPPGWLGWSFGCGSWPGQTRCPCPALCLPTVAPTRVWQPWLLLLPEVPGPACLAVTLLPAHPHAGQAPPAVPNSMRVSSCEKQTHLILSSHLLSLAYYRRDSTSKVSLLGMPQSYFPLSSNKSPLQILLPEKQVEKNSNECRLTDQDAFHKSKKISSS